MNIFKVLASGRNKFSEELSSAMLAWLLSPNLEHGLGSTFVGKFLESIAAADPDKDRSEEINQLIARIEPVLRTDGLSGSIPFELILEMKVGSDFIDIVLRLNNYWFSIENKIHDASVNQTKLQLRQQYDGLRKYVNEKHGEDHRVVSVFLVPNADSKKKAAVAKEVAALGEMASGDYDTLLSWRSEEMTLLGSDESGPRRSILGILREILQCEQNGELEPLSEYLRHTLKAFAAFIQNDFKGYPYEREASKGGQNEKTTGRFNLVRIKETLAGPEEQRVLSVGVAGGVAGLLRMSRFEVGEKLYQTSTFDMANSKNWLDKNDFLKIADWLMGVSPPPPDFEWKGRFLAPLLLRIAKAYGDSVYIGVQGGRSALNSMDEKEISSSRWGIAREKLSANWIPGTEYVAILGAKGIQSKE